LEKLEFTDIIAVDKDKGTIKTDYLFMTLAAGAVSLEINNWLVKHPLTDTDVIFKKG
jgi:hypothetical protein